jgi:outer membrane protein OmpA-like peptidoglycan-associated protein
MVRRMLTLVAVLALSMTVGCTTTQKWMAGGAIVGGAIGGPIGAHGCYGIGNAGEGVLWGALIGATSGGLIGNIIEQQQTERRIAEMQAEIDRLKKELADRDAALAAANRRIAELEAQLKNMPKGGVSVREFEISLGSDVLFRPGSARLSDAGQRALTDAANKLKSQYSGRFVMVEGHTDSQPIRVSGWKSNWELGAARALTVLHFLEEQGVPAEKLSAATFSKYQPIASNDTAEGRQQNRRAVIAVYKTWSQGTGR